MCVYSFSCLWLNYVYLRFVYLFSGQIAKVKLCSHDGETGFGWTKNAFGMKKWGFIRTLHCDTKPLSTTIIYKEPQKPTEGCASAVTDVN